ncbi:hypothetical protein Ancab_003664 [Ancistrocladus abbreviatus]
MVAILRTYPNRVVLTISMAGAAATGPGLLEENQVEKASTPGSLWGPMLKTAGLTANLENALLPSCGQITISMTAIFSSANRHCSNYHVVMVNPIASRSSVHLAFGIGANQCLTHNRAPTRKGALNTLTLSSNDHERRV